MAQALQKALKAQAKAFPISRDPPEGGTPAFNTLGEFRLKFPISRDPPEGGTRQTHKMT